MKAFLSICVALSLTLAAGVATAQETTVVQGVKGPEGPLWVDGSLYYVSWVSDTLSKWDGRTSTVVNHLAGCNHNGLALTRQKTFLVACTADPGAILELDLKGKLLRRWDADAKGAPMAGGVNDIVVAPNGGAYATLFGPYDNGPPGLIEGKVLYLAPGASAWVEVAGDLNYANGVAVSPDGKTLYVDQTVGNLMVKFAINDDGTLSRRANFALLNTLVPNRVNSWWLGPDSMKVDSKGDVYVAQWFGGKVLKLSPQGKLLHVFKIAAGDGTTNVAFGPGEKELYVTVVKDANDPQAAGAIVRIPNVE
ncbi:MAG TPA: SMP-30/gluconolactonase/LRE family protein [Caulobacteraceae bacterium]|jgi:gluconolactonase